MSRRYPQVYENEILAPVMSPKIFRHQCCDCGLVHDVELDVEDGHGKVIWRWKRNNRATAQVRRHRND